jgi:hypothetical protein
MIPQHGIGAQTFDPGLDDLVGYYQALGATIRGNGYLLQGHDTRCADGQDGDCHQHFHDCRASGFSF